MKNLVGVLLLLALILAILSESSSSSLLPSSPQISAPPSFVLNVLRSRGQHLLVTKKYADAGLYYRLALDVIKKNPTVWKSNAMLSRCALTLAECELQSGQYGNAVLLCTDLIKNLEIKQKQQADEQPDKVIGKALMRRGRALNKLGYHRLALVDFEDYQQMFPEDSEIDKYILECSVDGDSEVATVTKKERSKIDANSKQSDISVVVESLRKQGSGGSKKRSKQDRQKKDILKSIHHDYQLSLSKPKPIFGDSLDGVDQVLSVLRTFNLCSPQTVVLLSNFFRVASRVFKVLRTVYNSMTSNSPSVLIILSVVWMLSSKLI